MLILRCLSALSAMIIFAALMAGRADAAATRLAGQASPYLRLHAADLVDWRPG
ncbi:MAG: hypothetical protein VW268_02500 [Rhodospirillaceae bacterium]